MFALAWEYLTGRVVATDSTDRHSAEWPPHPDRVFQSLVASWGERGNNASERNALCWLEELGPPGLAAPDDGDDGVRRNPVVKVYVPVNDLDGPRRGAYSDKQLALIPAHRTRKERFFPSAQVGTTTCALVWPDTVMPAEHRPALERLCYGVTYLGHSSSLVRMWLADAPPSVIWLPVEEGRRGSLPLRIAEQGRMDILIRAYADGGTQWQRPPMARWWGYQRAGTGSTAPRSGTFDEKLLVLKQVAGKRFDLRQTLALADALRKTLMSHAVGDALELISGHQPDGRPSLIPHVAYLPLPFVGHDHADGHLLGLALALPANLSFDAEDEVLSALFKAMDPERLTLTLTLGKLGTATLAVDDQPGQLRALRPLTWTRPSLNWGSVTPIVLDRLPPRGCKDLDEWAASQIAIACERQGLPRPVEVGVMPVSPCSGTPIARDFLPVIDNDGRRRWHVHAVLTFAERVTGPLLLGAGRFRGYGFCRPLREELSP